MKLKFEMKNCTRCGGSGRYSYNPEDGDRCFGCGGSGRQRTKAGVAAGKAYEAAMAIPVGECVPGTVLIVRLLQKDLRLGRKKRVRVVSIASSMSIWRSWSGIPQVETSGHYTEITFEDANGDYVVQNRVMADGTMTLALTLDTSDRARVALAGMPGVTIEE
jgi:hypothetical protein